MKRTAWWTIILLPVVLALLVLIVFFHQIIRLPSDFREWLYLHTTVPAAQSLRTPEDFNFLVAGHIYGSPNIPDHQPARLLLERLPELIASDPDFMVSLGDLVYQKKADDFSRLDKLFLSKLPFTIYNTPGNHDVANDRSYYEKYFGNQTYFSKEYGPATLIFLDTELADCRLDGDQRVFLQQALDHAIADPSIRFIFVFMHKTLAFQDVEMRKLDSKLTRPNVWDCQKKDGSNSIMAEFFIPAAREKPVYLFAGDVGAWGNLSPYYQRDPWLPLTLVMTGMGDTPQDHIIRVHVTPDAVSMDALFLSDMHSEPLTNYDRDYWLDIARNH